MIAFTLTTKGRVSRTRMFLDSRLCCLYSAPSPLPPPPQQKKKEKEKENLGITNDHEILRHTNSKIYGKETQYNEISLHWPFVISMFQCICLTAENGLRKTKQPAVGNFHSDSKSYFGFVVDEFLEHLIAMILTLRNVC